MASIGLGIARGNELYDQEVTRREELDRFLAGRALYDLALQDQEIQAQMQLSESQQAKGRYDAALPFMEQAVSGDPFAFEQLSSALDLGYTYDDGTNEWYKDGKKVGKLSATNIASIVGQAMPTAYQQANAAYASETANQQDQNAHLRELSLLDYKQAHALELAAMEGQYSIASSRARAGNGGGSGVSGFDVNNLDHIVYLEQTAYESALYNIHPNAVIGEDGIPTVDGKPLSADELAAVQEAANATIDQALQVGAPSLLGMGRNVDNIARIKDETGTTFAGSIHGQYLDNVNTKRQKDKAIEDANKLNEETTKENELIMLQKQMDAKIARERAAGSDSPTSTRVAPSGSGAGMSNYELEQREQKYLEQRNKGISMIAPSSNATAFLVPANQGMQLVGTAPTMNRVNLNTGTLLI